MEAHGLRLQLQKLSLGTKPLTKNSKPDPTINLFATLEVQQRKTNFFSLPQILRQAILFESLDYLDIRDLAQIALRRSQDAFLARKERERYVYTGWSVDNDKTYHYFIELYAKRLASTHWVIYHDLKLVRKMWFAVYTNFPRIYKEEGLYTYRDDDGSRGYRERNEGFVWSAEAALCKIEAGYGISNQRAHLLPGAKRCNWVKLTGLRPFTVAQVIRAEREGRDLDSGLDFEELCQFAFPERYLRTPTLKWHKSKKGLYPAMFSADPRRRCLPFELWRPILLYMFPASVIDRLAKIQFHHARTGTRFIAGFVCKMARVHPGLTDELYWLETHLNTEVTKRIKKYRKDHEAGVKRYKEMLRDSTSTNEECDELQASVHEAMRPWKAHTYKLNLLGLEDVYAIPEEYRSSVTRSLRVQMKKRPEDYVGTRTGKYRYALESGGHHRVRRTGCDRRPWSTGFNDQEWWDDDD